MIEVDAPSVGMFVHLDLSWMSHPFPVGSFKVSSAEQIESIRSLCLKKLRWCPGRSDFAPLSTGPASAPGSPGVSAVANTPDVARPLSPRSGGAPCAQARRGRPEGRARPLRAPVQRGVANRQAPERHRPRQTARGAGAGRDAVEGAGRQDACRRRPVRAAAHRCGGRQDLDARAERHRHLAAHGTRLRLVGARHARPRRRRHAARYRQDRDAHALAPPRRELQPVGGEFV